MLMSLPPGRARSGLRAHRDGGVRRREAHGVLGELGQQVREVDDGVPDHGALLVDDEHDALEVLGLGDGRAQHVAQRDGLAPRARGLLAREHEQVLRVAPHPGGDVIQREQVGERIGVALRLLELVDDLQLPVQEALVAAGEVGEQVGRELAPVDLGIGEPAAQHVLLALRVFGDPQHEERSGAGDQHRHAVDHRPQPGVLLPLGVFEDQCLLPRGADPVADHGEDDVDEERRPVLVERDEADDDEEVEVRLDGAVREHDERRRAVDQPHRDGDRRGPPVVAQQVTEPHQRQRGDHDQCQRARCVTERETEGEQAGSVQRQDPKHEAVTPLPILFGQVVAMRKGIEELSPHRVVHHFFAHTDGDLSGSPEMVGGRETTAV